MRATTKVTAGLGAGMLALTMMAGCGMPTNVAEVLPVRFVEQTAVSDAARAAYGEEAALAAYNELADWSLAQWLREPLLDPEVTPERDHFVTGIVDRLAPDTAQYWMTEVDKALAGDENARTELEILRFHTWEGLQLSLPRNSPIDSQAISGGEVDLGEPTSDGMQPLTVTFTHTARLDLLNNRDPYPGTLQRQVTLTVLPAQVVRAQSDPAAVPGGEINPDANWLITEYEGGVEAKFDKDDGSEDEAESSTAQESAPA